MSATELLEHAEGLLLARQLPQARRALEEAAAAGADPDRCAGALWQTHMLAGDFAAAWAQSDALRHRNAPDPHRLWQGEDLSGKRVIVRCLHGFGDTVQMLRYAPLLNQRAAHVTWEVPPRLLPLAPFFAGVTEAITWGEQAPAQPPAWEVQIEVMELPYLFRTSLADLPLRTSYLRVPAHPATSSRAKPRIGLAWSAADWNPSRSVPFASIEPLLRTPGFEFWSLQTQPSPLPSLIHQPSMTGDGILPLAQAIAALDLVITVDTLAAHLAGALGRPAWLLLQAAADWRWLHLRDDSPWYPSLTLFRQPAPGDWSSVLTQVQQRLATLNL
jgi:hypothetical protein